jgi:ubiquinone/menaquinone biosynthesis C-methylase UbiE
VALQDISVVHRAPAVDRGEESLAQWRARFPWLHLDLGCGDARFALREARLTTELGVVGIDTCLDNLRIPRRSMPANLRLIQADGRDIVGLPGVYRAERITINFPYGSLLRWIVDDADACIDELTMVTMSRATLEIRINVSALREIGAPPEDVERRLLDAFAQQSDWRAAFRTMDRAELRAFPSTWARRIGYGRETTALLVIARRVG